MQPIHALSTEHVVGEVLVYNFQILFKQTSIIAPDIYKHVSVLPSQRYQLSVSLVAQRDMKFKLII